jgi:signal transduction histidine kinase
MNLDLIILSLSSVAIALLALIIYIRNPSEMSNRRFAVLSLVMVSWVIFNYLSDYSTAHDLLFTRLVFVGGVLSISGLLLFIYDFPSKSLLPKKFVLYPHLALTAILIPLFFTPYFINSVGEESINTGFLYAWFVAYVLYSMMLYVVIARKQFSLATGHMQRRQVSIVFGSMALYAGLSVASNVIIPLLINNWTSSRLGPIFSLIFVGAVGYSVIKYRLFDIKFLIFRSIGYIVSLFVIGLAAFVSLTWLSTFFDNSNASRSLQVNTLILVTLVLAVLYQPSKRVFEKFIGKLFYKDAYDTRALLDEFNQALASTIVLDELLSAAAKTIEKFVKAQSVTFVIRGNEDQGIRIIPSSSSINERLVEHVDSYLQRSKDQLLFTDLLEEQATKRLLQKADAGSVAQIILDKNAGVTGYLILGYKKSGDGYSGQDREALKIMANGLSVAVHNALQFDEIQRLSASLEQKVQDATKNLRHSNAKLRMLDQTKDDFISMASHQLRTPLTSVKGYVSMVLDGDAGKITPLQRKLLTQSFISSQRMVYLISDLLNVSRLRTGKFIIEPVPCNLARVISDEVEQLVETAKGRNLELVYNKPENFPTFMLDETKVRQVIMNFIDNAIYYTPSGGRIEINLVERQKAIEFTVVDNGMGVTKAEQHHLFTKFFRANNAKRARPDGTGLGLFMAKKVIIAQGGAIIFRSQEGKGSTFGFTFAKEHLQLVAEK